MLDYFTRLHNTGASYIVLNSNKSALSHVMFLPPYSPISEYPQIVRYLKGVYNLRPPTPTINLVTKWKMTNYQIKSLNKNVWFCFYCWEVKQRTQYTFFTAYWMTVTDIIVTFSPNHVLTLPPHSFFVLVKSRSMLHHGSVGASSE